MRPRTLRRRGQFYRRKRSRWRLSLTLALVGVALAGFVVLNMGAGGTAPGPAGDMTKPIVAAAPATQTPAPTAPAELGSTTLAAAASAPVSAGRLDRPGFLVAGRSPDAVRRDVDGVGARLALSTVRDGKVKARATGPRLLAGAAMPTPAAAETCKTCGDDVPF